MEPEVGGGDADPQDDNQFEGSNQDSDTDMSSEDEDCEFDEGPRLLMEVFSVKFIEYQKHDLVNRMYGCILIHTSTSYVVFNRKRGAPLNVDSKGYVKLRGLNQALEPCDYARFNAYLFSYEGCVDQFPGKYDRCFTMWNSYTCRNYDMFLTTTMASRYGPIEVNYVVYKWGVDAYVEFEFADCQLYSAAIYGTITARNSELLHNEAKSVLFDKDRTEAIYMDVSSKGNVAYLPLLKCKTAHPYNSVVIISLDMNIMQCGNIEAQGQQPVAVKEDLKFSTRLSGQDMQYVVNDVCLIKASIIWNKIYVYPDYSRVV